MIQEGTVKWFSEEKDYGFISADDGGEELFVHYTDIEGSGYRSLEEARGHPTKLRPPARRGRGIE